MKAVKRYWICGVDALLEQPSDIRQSSGIVMAYDFDAEHALRLEAERKVGELREHLATQRNHFVEQLRDAKKAYALQAKLDTAMELLRKGRGIVRGPEYKVWLYGVDAFLNTTSTEGKDHD